MRCTIAFMAALVGSAMARPLTAAKSKKTTKVHPGGIDDLIITKENTINGTYAPNATDPVHPMAASLPLSFVNSYSGGAVNAYVTGLDTNNQVVFLSSASEWIYPSSGGSATPVAVTEDVAIPLGAEGTTLDVTLPDFISAARIWFAEGDLQFFMVASDSGESLVTPSAVNTADPSADVNWGFVELTNNSSGIYANISYVDFVGMILGMMLSVNDGTTQTTPGLTSDAVTSICNDLIAQSAVDAQAWSEMCIVGSSGNPLRVLSPQDYGSSDSTAFADYWTSYVDDVWTQYSSEPLNINTQADAGTVACTVSGDTLTCDGDNRGYAKPVPGDIWGCNSGPFAIESDDNDVHRAVVPRLCAAFNRATLLLDGGNTQPSLDSSSYYTTSPNNHYSRIVHNYEVDGKGYAFSYDDVNPDGENASGVVSSGDPASLTIYVGAPPS